MSTSTQNFKGQVVIVTGASSGIGQACAIHFGSLGAHVVVNYLSSEEEANVTLDQIIDVNLTGQFLCIREAARQFVKQAQADPAKVPHKAIGKIVMMSSVHDIIPWAGHVNYAASKGGIMMLMRSVSQELAPQGVRINSVSPGAIRTPINKSVWSDEAKMKELMHLIPYRRIGTPDDVAKAVAWLASDDSDYVNGETLYIDGGMTLFPEFADNG